MTDREEAGLRGIVRSCRNECDYTYPARNWVIVTENMFTVDGRLMERHHHNPSGMNWSSTYRFDEQGRISERYEWAVEGDIRHTFSYTYDSLDRLERIVLRSEELGEHVYESMRYDADGTKAVTQYPVPRLDEEGRNISVSLECALHLSTDAVAIMTIFDAQDRPVRRVLYDMDDRVIRRVGFRYDSRGLLIEEGELIAGQIREDFRNTYRYDGAGRPIEIHRRSGDMGSLRRTFAYNEHGDVVEERVEQEEGLVLEGGPDDWTQKYVFEYDRLGNWTQRRTETFTSDGGAHLSLIESRDLAYY